MNEIKKLFLEQSYKDVNSYLEENIRSGKYDAWDYIVITASNDLQAQIYELQIESKLASGFIDPRPKYIVIPDKDNERIGSGGATFNVLATLKTDYDVDFDSAKILLIHSGGDSKRIPQYSACGKLFSPVPRELDEGYGATLFDELLATTALIPSRMNAGVMTMSGDVELLFNPLQFEFKGVDISSISIKKSAEIGQNHGVFLTDHDGHLLEFLHKKSVAELEAKGATDDSGNINIDTGIILFSGKIANKMLSLISTDNSIDSKKLSAYVNSKIRLSFYGDLLYPFAQSSDYDEYMKEPAEGTYSDELLECRKAIWDTFHGTCMKVVSVHPAEFLHFGTTHEMFELVTRAVKEYRHLGWKKNIASSHNSESVAMYNSAMTGSNAGRHVYIENSYVKDCTFEKNAIISNVRIEGVNIPDGVVLSGLKLKNGKFVVRIYGINDNPKTKVFDNCLFGQSMSGFLLRHNLKAEEISEDGALWTARIYPVADDMKTAVTYALRLYDMLYKADDSFYDEWVSLDKESLNSSYNNVDPKKLITWNAKLRGMIGDEKILSDLKNRVDFKDILSHYRKADLKQHLDWFIAHIDDYPSELYTRIYLLASMVEDDKDKVNKYQAKVFDIISENIISESKDRNDKALVKSVEVALPARVNFGGGWTDTPPYCYENGGTVLNAAITLNGICPIVATVERLKDRKIVLESEDLHVSKDIYTRDEIVNSHSPFDRVALQKAALVVMGIVTEKDDADLTNVFDTLGGGIKVKTSVKNIPSGSGLGTSSILAAACVKALYEARGIEYTIQDVSTKVMQLEQQMSTGGGWQDQIGGAINGIKVISSHKGKQELVIRDIEISDELKKELSRRLVLVYTGQRRLARNILRDIVFSYLSGDSETLDCLANIENIAILMAHKLHKGDLNEFAKLMNKHWEYSRLLDLGTSNTCIDYIFESCADLIDGKMICGAGGGGFIQVILKNGVLREDLEQRINETFADAGVVVYDAELCY